MHCSARMEVKRNDGAMQTRLTARVFSKSCDLGSGAWNETWWNLFGPRGLRHWPTRRERTSHCPFAGTGRKGTSSDLCRKRGDQVRFVVSKDVFGGRALIPSRGELRAFRDRRSVFASRDIKRSQGGARRRDGRSTRELRKLGGDGVLRDCRCLSLERPRDPTMV